LGSRSTIIAVTVWLKNFNGLLRVGKKRDFSRTLIVGSKRRQEGSGNG